MSFFELKVALRYIKGKKEKNKFISFISFMSMLGIILGVATLIIVLSLMNGFKYETVNNVLSKTAHIKLLGDLENKNEVIEFSKSHSEVKDIAANIIVPSALSKDDDFKNVYIVGLDNAVVDFQSMKEQSVELKKLFEKENKFGVLLADKYKKDYNEGDSVLLYSPELQSTPIGSTPRYRSFKILGFLDSSMQMKGFSENTAYISNDDAKRLLRVEDNILLWELKDFWQAEKIKNEIAEKFSINPELNDFISWEALNKDLLSILKVEKLMTFIILMLIIVVAAFNLISSLVMTVNEKRGEIAILRTMGCKRSSILTIFIIQGSFVGIIGTIIGVLLGIIVSLNVMEIIYFIQAALKIDFLDDFLNTVKLSSVIIPMDIILITVFSLLLSLLVTIYPSWSATKVLPAEALKNE